LGYSTKYKIHIEHIKQIESQQSAHSDTAIYQQPNTNGKRTIATETVKKLTAGAI